MAMRGPVCDLQPDMQSSLCRAKRWMCSTLSVARRESAFHHRRLKNERRRVDAERKLRKAPTGSGQVYRVRQEEDWTARGVRIWTPKHQVHVPRYWYFGGSRYWQDHLSVINHGVCVVRSALRSNFWRFSSTMRFPGGRTWQKKQSSRHQYPSGQDKHRHNESA